MCDLLYNFIIYFKFCKKKKVWWCRENLEIQKKVESRNEIININNWRS